jgi:hypothetical protein
MTNDLMARFIEHLGYDVIAEHAAQTSVANRPATREPRSPAAAVVSAAGDARAAAAADEVRALNFISPSISASVIGLRSGSGSRTGRPLAWVRTDRGGQPADMHDRVADAARPGPPRRPDARRHSPGSPRALAAGSLWPNSRRFAYSIGSPKGRRLRAEQCQLLQEDLAAPSAHAA